MRLGANFYAVEVVEDVVDESVDGEAVAYGQGSKIDRNGTFM
jgi:hypothetical protein